MKVVVSGDLGRFKQGQILTEDKEIAAYYRDSVNEGADKPCKLSDEQILDIVKKVPAGTDNLDPDDIDVVRTEALEAAE